MRAFWRGATCGAPPGFFDVTRFGENVPVDQMTKIETEMPHFGENAAGNTHAAERTTSETGVTHIGDNVTANRDTRFTKSEAECTHTGEDVPDNKEAAVTKSDTEMTHWHRWTSGST